MIDRPFEGLRILDSTYIIAFPYAAGILADFGAEVIKIEGPGHPEGTRDNPIPAENNPGADFWNRGSEFNLLNRGKKSLVLDMNHEKARAIFVELVKKSDVVMENFTPRIMKRWGLDYPNLRKINPRIIMMSNTGYGHGDGPYANYPAQATSQEGMHGHVHVTGYRDGPPSKAGQSFADFLSTFTCLFALTGALHHRKRTGEGQWVDIGMYQIGCMLVGEYITDYRSNGRTGTRIGNRHPFRAPQGVYRALGDDAWIAISVGSDAQWRSLCEVMGMPDLATDARFADGPGRMKHHDDLDVIITSWTAAREKYEVMQLLQEQGIPAGPVNNGRDLHLDPQMQARGFMERVAFPPERKIGERLLMGRPWKLSNINARIQGPGPAFGQHNEEILTKLVGLDIETVKGLEAEGIIATKPIPGSLRHEDIPREELVKRARYGAVDMDYLERLGERAE